MFTVRKCKVEGNGGYPYVMGPAHTIVAKWWAINSYSIIAKWVYHLCCGSAIWHQEH